MTSRRDFLKTAGAATAGVAAASTASAATETNAMARKYSGPHEMPTNVTLLSMRNADGTETLGVKPDNDEVLDVRKASQLLGVAAPETLEQLLKEGNAGGLSKLVAAAKILPRPRRFGSRNLDNLRQAVHPPGQDRLHRPQLQGPSQEVNEKLPRVPILFNKYNNALAAHNCTIKLPPKEVPTSSITKLNC